MKQKLARLVSLLCLVATLATCLVIVPVRVSAASGAYSYKDAVVGSGEADEYVSVFGGGIMKSDLHSLIQRTVMADSEQTYYEAYFKQFETEEFANGLDNREAQGYAEAFETCAAALFKPASVIVGYKDGAVSPDQFEDGAFVGEGMGLWVHFDLYFDDAHAPMRDPSGSANIIRFNKLGGFYLKNSGKDASGVYRTRTLTPYKNVTGDPIVIERDGWNRISVFFRQSVEIVGGASGYEMGETTYHMTVFVNGEGGTEWTGTTESAIPLYTVSSFDEITGAVAAKNCTWANGLELYFDTYRSGDYDRRLTRFSLKGAEVGTIDDLSVRPLSLALADGLTLPTEEVDPLDEQIIPSGYTFVPVADENGKLSYPCDAKEVRNYYDAEAFSLPTPVGVALGREAVWLDSEGNEVTDTPTEALLGDGRLTAKLAPEGDYTLTVSSKGETLSCRPAGNAFTLGDESAYWFFEGEVYAAGETILLTADATVYALAPTMLSGASVRTEEQSSGLRFETVIDRGLLDALEGDFTIGTLVIPTDLLGSTAFTAAALDAAGKAYLTLEGDPLGCDAVDGGVIFRAAIVGIKSQNYTRRFSAISYIRYDGAYYYAEYSAADHSRSVYEVAVQSDKKNPTASYADVVRGFINGVVEIKDGAQVAPYAGYTHPLSASIADGVLTVTGEGLSESALKTVLLDGVAYTGGWRFEGGSFKATLPDDSSEK